MVTLVAAIFILGVFDLLLTLLAHAMGLLDERNPVARAALGRGAATLLVFKICLTLVGCALLLLARAARMPKDMAPTEAAAWVATLRIVMNLDEFLTRE